MSFEVLSILCGECDVREEPLTVEMRQLLVKRLPRHIPVVDHDLLRHLGRREKSTERKNFVGAAADVGCQRSRQEERRNDLRTPRGARRLLIAAYRSGWSHPSQPPPKQPLRGTEIPDFTQKSTRESVQWRGDAINKEADRLGCLTLSPSLVHQRRRRRGGGGSSDEKSARTEPAAGQTGHPLFSFLSLV